MIFTKRKLQNDCQLPYVRTDMTFFLCVRERRVNHIRLTKRSFWLRPRRNSSLRKHRIWCQKDEKNMSSPIINFQRGIPPPPLRLLSDPLNMHTLFRFTICICVTWVSVCGDHSYVVCIVPIHAWKNKSSRFCPHLIVYKLSNVDLSYYPWRQTSFRLSFPPFHLLDAHAF